MDEGKHVRKQTPNESLDELFARSLHIRNGPEFRKMLDFLARFKNYSIYNNLLVYFQNPNCRYYATAKDWKKRFNRYPKPESRPLIILAPKHPVLFVFDIDDTEGESVPNLLNNPFEVEGSFDFLNFLNLKGYAESLGIKIIDKPLDFRHGGSIYRVDKYSKPQIDLNLKQKEAINFATLVHEMAHLMLGHLGSANDESWPARDENVMSNKAVREIEAESVAYLVLMRLNLQNKAAEYLAFYNSNPDDFKKISLDLIIKVASRIEAIAKST